MPVSYSYQWQRSPDGSTGWTDIAGASGTFTGSPPFTQTEDYTVQAADVGDYLRMKVTDGVTVWYSNTLGPATDGSTGTPLFDGRASLLSSFPTTSGSGGSTVVSGGATMWDGYLFMGSDISLTTDATWSKAYNVQPASGHHNPYNTGAPAYDTSAQITKVRPTGLGTTLWYANSIKILSSGWGHPDWCTIMSLGYETLQYDQIDISVFGSTWGTQQNTGYTSGPSGGTRHVIDNLMAVTFDQWEDWVIGVKWETDNTGFIQMYHRIHGGSWSEVYNVNGIPTYLYGTNSPYASVSQDMHDKTTVVDKEGLYCGNWSQALPAPTGHIQTRGMQRWDNLTDAQASLA